MAWRMGVDSGGTFADVCLFDEASGGLAVWKVSSTPADPSDAVANGVREALAQINAPARDITYFGHGTRVATNALTQHRGARIGLITSDGFRDLLEIGRQKRPDLYDFRRTSPACARGGGARGYPITAPMLDIHTVGAAGGSIADVDSGGLQRRPSCQLPAGCRATSNPGFRSPNACFRLRAVRPNVFTDHRGATRAPDDMTSLPSELHWLTIADASRLIERRSLSPVELTDALIARAEALDPQINAFLLPTPGKAREQARAAEREIMAGSYRGPLHGVPFALKDIYCTGGIRTTSHSKICENLVPTEDATTITKMYEAGAVLLGKLATHEFAHGGPSFDLPWPPARNPWNREHFTGGSSSGAGAAIAAGFTPGALGSDTGGSIRGPAAYCGIVGLKPTYGLVSRAGVYANSFTFDHAGPMSWTVEDCAILLQALAGHDPKDPASANRPIPDYRAALTGDIKGLRIGVLRHLYEEEVPVAPEVKAALEEVYAVFRSLGASLEDVRIRPAADYYAVKITIAESEQYAIHEEELRSRPGDFGADFLGRALPAVLYSGTDYVQAQRERRLMLAEMEAVYAKYDVLLTPTASGPAPRLDAWRTIRFWQSASLTTPFNVTGGPALAQCMGFTPAGLPLSLQIVGRPFEEATVLRAAHAYEMATQWRARRPNLDPGTAFSTALPSTPPLEPAGDAATRALVLAACRRAHLSLNDSQIDMICAAAPYVMAMTRRLRRERDFREEPANCFQFPV